MFIVLFTILPYHFMIISSIWDDKIPSVLNENKSNVEWTM